VLFGVLGLLGLGLVYLLAWPTGLDPQAWQPPKSAGLVGPYQKNDALAKATWLAKDLPGPECVAVGPDGWIYTGTIDGRIVRLARDGSGVETVAKTGGRPLGLEFDARGRLFIADADRGLLRLGEGGAIEVLATEAGGRNFRFVDDVAIATDGTVYFTDASSRWPLRQFKMDVLEHRGSGRLLAWREGEPVRVVAGDLYFANGVALGPGDTYALVAETSSYRITRVFLSGPRAGEREVFVDNLPGFPDNITWSAERRAFWVAVGPPRDKTLDALGPRPFLRGIVARLPDALQPQPKRHGFAFAFDEAGRLVANLQDPGPSAYAPIASVIEVGGALWLGSFMRPGLATLPAPPLPASEAPASPPSATDQIAPAN
jgi:sugar lactone lactonase YvrE